MYVVYIYSTQYTYLASSVRKSYHITSNSNRGLSYVSIVGKGNHEVSNLLT